MTGYPISECEDTKNFDALQDPDSKFDLNHFFKGCCLQVEGYDMNDDGQLSLYVRSTETYGICPYCQTVSHKVHSRYTRRLQDLPAFGQNVILCFRTRKFFCHNEECKIQDICGTTGQRDLPLSAQDPSLRGSGLQAGASSILHKRLIHAGEYGCRDIEVDGPS